MLRVGCVNINCAAHYNKHLVTFVALTKDHCVFGEKVQLHAPHKCLGSVSIVNLEKSNICLQIHLQVELGVLTPFIYWLADDIFNMKHAGITETEVPRQVEFIKISLFLCLVLGVHRSWWEPGSLGVFAHTMLEQLVCFRYTRLRLRLLCFLLDRLLFLLLNYFPEILSKFSAIFFLVLDVLNTSRAVASLRQGPRRNFCHRLHHERDLPILGESLRCGMEEILSLFT